MNQPNGHAVPDQIDAAIAAVNAPATQPVAEIRVTLSSGRQALMVIPIGLTDSEILDLVAGLSTQLRASGIQARATDPRSRIVIPGR